MRACLAAALALSATLAVAQPAAKPGVDWVTSVILSQARPIDGKRIASAVRKRVAESDRFTGFESDGDVVLLRIADGTAMVSLMEAPIPNGELQDVCRFAWHWREACDTVKDHRAHILVMLMGTNLAKLDSALLQTRIVAAVIEESDAVAAYWGVNLQPRDVFLKGSTTASREKPPVPLWINYRLSREPSGNLNISTRGLKDFNLMEVETKDASKPGREVFDLVLGTTVYLLTKGPVIKDGDTIGESPRLGIRVRHAESYWNPGEKVYRIVFGR